MARRSVNVLGEADRQILVHALGHLSGVYLFEVFRGTTMATLRKAARGEHTQDAANVVRACIAERAQCPKCHRLHGHSIDLVLRSSPSVTCEDCFLIPRNVYAAPDGRGLDIACSVPPSHITFATPRRRRK